MRVFRTFPQEKNLRQVRKCLNVIWNQLELTLASERRAALSKHEDAPEQLYHELPKPAWWMPRGERGP